MNCAEISRTCRRRSGAKANVDWRLGLPAEWQAQVVAPFDIACHVDYEMPASRCLGHDVDARLCFYAHDYRVEEMRSDDDEDFYETVAYGETVRAWRLCDERWLIYRQLQLGDECGPGRGFFTLAENPPEAAR